MAQHAAGFAGHVHTLRKLTKMLKRRLLGCLARPLRFCLERLVSVCSLQQQWSARPNQPTQVCSDQVCSFEQTSFAVQIVVLPHCGHAAEKGAPFSADRSLIAAQRPPCSPGRPVASKSVWSHRIMPCSFSLLPVLCLSCPPGFVSLSCRGFLF